MATQKTRNQDTYVGDRPNRNRNFGPSHQGQGQGQGMGGGQGGYMGGNQMGAGGPSGGGMPNMGNMGNMGGMGGGMNPMAGMGMGNMGMGAMSGGGAGGQQAFDPYAMSQFFKQVSFFNSSWMRFLESRQLIASLPIQMGWGNFNPMMLMQAGMMSGGQGGMMPGMMDPSAMMNVSYLPPYL